jgi:hypothetical protein
MKRTHNKATLTTVRLFPRLAARPNAKTQAECRHITSVDSAGNQRAKSSSDVRARLLKMIVDNERVRRQEPHAS